MIDLLGLTEVGWLIELSWVLDGIIVESDDDKDSTPLFVVGE